MLLTMMGLNGTPSLCILGSPYILGGLEPAELSCQRVSSVSEDFLSSNVVFVLLDLWSLRPVFCTLDLPEER
jgi:hypothetical protein